MYVLDPDTARPHLCAQPPHNIRRESPTPTQTAHSQLIPHPPRRRTRITHQPVETSTIQRTRPWASPTRHNATRDRHVPGLRLVAHENVSVAQVRVLRQRGTGERAVEDAHLVGEGLEGELQFQRRGGAQSKEVGVGEATYCVAAVVAVDGVDGEGGIGEDGRCGGVLGDCVCDYMGCDRGCVDSERDLWRKKVSVCWGL